MNWKLLLVAVLALTVTAKKTPHNWKTGTLLESAESRETSGGGGAVAISQSGSNSNPAMAAANNAMLWAGMAASLPQTQTWQGFVIQGGGYVYMVKRLIIRSRPNVTIHGPIKYAIEKGGFFILDEDGREFSMIVMKKALSSAPEKP